jgi:hypothetical protein
VDPRKGEPGERLYLCPETGFEAFLLTRVDGGREQLERELLEAGVHLPLPHRVAWARGMGGQGTWFIGVRDAKGGSHGGFAINVSPSRSLPGHRLLRVTRLGPGLPGATLRVGLAGLAALADRHPRILRITVNAFSRTSLGDIGAALSDLGFREVRPPSSYRYTLVVNLSEDLEATMAALHSSARRNIRRIQTAPVDVRGIADARLAPRVAELQNLALRRTGAQDTNIDWMERINLSQARPELSNLLGLFHREMEGPESLLAFAWGCHHGDHAEYHSGGSARLAGPRLPLAYGLMWELISWARHGGATWFDLGGTTTAVGPHEEDPDGALDGITQFKRFFSRDLAEVGAEWQLEPHPVRARLAQAISGAAGGLRDRAAKART